MRKLLKRQGIAPAIVTDRLGSYSSSRTWCCAPPPCGLAEVSEDVQHLTFVVYGGTTQVAGRITGQGILISHCDKPNDV
jgi:hypothetical protein